MSSGDKSSETARIFSNTLAQSAPVVTSFGLSFLLAPIMLNRLGLAQFGVWAVTGALAQYASLLDLGVTNSLARFIAVHEAHGERRKVEEVIGIGLIVAVLVGVVMLTAAVLVAPAVSDALGVLATDQMRIVLVSSAAIGAFYLLAAVLGSVPLGLRRMGPPNVAATIGNIANFVFSLVALALSSRLPVYAVANAAAAGVTLLLGMASFAYVWSRPFARRPTGAHAREIVSFGFKSQLIGLAELVNSQTDKLIIAAMLGARTAGAYEIGNRIVQGVRSLGQITLLALIPTASADLVKRGREVIGEYYSRYTVRTLAIALPIFGAVSVGAPYLLVAWLGELPQDTAAVVVLLAATYSIAMISGVAMTLTMSDGHPGVVAQNAVLVVCLNIAATLVAAPLFGIWGVLLATVGAQMAAAAVFLVRFHRRYSLSSIAFRGAVAKPIVVSVLAALPFALWYVFAGEVPAGRGSAIVGVICTSGLYGALCWLVESRLGLLPEKLSAAAVRRRMPGGRRRVDAEV